MGGIEGEYEGIIVGCFVGELEGGKVIIVGTSVIAVGDRDGIILGLNVG